MAENESSREVDTSSSELPINERFQINAVLFLNTWLIIVFVFLMIAMIHFSDNLWEIVVLGSFFVFANISLSPIKKWLFGSFRFPIEIARFTISLMFCFFMSVLSGPNFPGVLFSLPIFFIQPVFFPFRYSLVSIFVLLLASLGGEIYTGGIGLYLYNPLVTISLFISLVIFIISGGTVKLYYSHLKIIRIKDATISKNRTKNKLCAS